MFAFEGGRLTQARLPRALDTLGVVLKDADRITQAQLDESVARVLLEDGLQGAVLVSLGACDCATVEWGLEAQLRRKALRLFTLLSAPFEAHSEVDLLIDFGGKRAAVEVHSFLWEGVRAHPEHPAVEAAVGRIGSRCFRLIPDSIAATMVSDDPTERALLERVQQPVRMNDLLAGGPDPAFTRAFVAMLMMTRQLERVSDPVTQSSPGTSSSGRLSAVSSPFVVPVSSTSSTVVVPVSAPRTASSSAVVPVSGPPRTISSSAVAPVSGPPRTISTSGFAPLGTTPLTQPPEGAPAGTSLPPFVFSGARPANDTTREPNASPADLEAARKVARQADLQRAEQFLRQRRLIDAERCARLLLLEDSGDTDALLLLATVLLENYGTARIEEVKKSIATALTNAPEHDRGFVVAAGMYRRLGDEKRALTCFMKAYKLNPRNVDAARELRLAAMRRRNERDAGDVEGFLAKLFGNGG